MVLDGGYKDQTCLVPHSDMYKIEQDQDSVMTEESQADSWDWGEACRESCHVIATVLRELCNQHRAAPLASVSSWKAEWALFSVLPVSIISH